MIARINLEPRFRTSRLARLRVSAIAGQFARGKLLAGSLAIPCVLGPGGISCLKREGDGRTPRGVHGLTALLYRSDRLARPLSGLPRRAIQRRDGWCDEPGSALYNRPVRLPFAGSHEVLWRGDRLYDLLVVVAYNTEPVRKGRGSAIFLHVEAPDRTPTAGCVAVHPTALRRLLLRLGPKTRLAIT